MLAAQRLCSPVLFDAIHSSLEAVSLSYMPSCVYTLRRLIIVQGGLIRSTGVVLVVLVLVFLVPGVVFLVLVDVVACHYVYYH